MPCSMFQILYTIAFERMKMQEETEEGKEQAQADAVEDALEEGGLIP